ncbi:MAG: diguanylate cyclase [Deltaproteobacteria bacterium]|nr:diguanylate cyclase [Deltaproteobacteria bacterium]
MITDVQEKTDSADSDCCGRLDEKVRDRTAELEKEVRDRRRAEKALKESRELLNSFMESATDGFIVFDTNLNLIEINRAALDMASVGTRKSDFVGRNLADLYAPVRHEGRMRKYLDVIRTGEPFFVEDAVPLGFNEIHLSVKAFKVGEGLGLILTDVTERKKLEQKLTLLATTDHLTGAANRRRFFEIGEKELTRARRHGHELAVLMMDLDRFKQINDMHGHQAGDEALKLVVGACRETLRTEDALGRLGGEEGPAARNRTGRRPGHGGTSARGGRWSEPYVGFGRFQGDGQHRHCGHG